ncbi:MAG: metal ABC transporter permease [Phycisphaerae bacterium]|nr:metal ABC transporter permease [Phycisphaerae bacterium]
MNLRDALMDPNVRTVLWGTTALGAASGAVGAFTTLRRRALLGDALSHAALPGVCLAYFAFGSKHLGLFMIGALVAGLAGSACIAALARWTRVRQDAATALVLSGFFGLGIVLSRAVQSDSGGSAAGVDGFILGKAASMTQADSLTVGACGLAVILALLALARPLKVAIFDPSFARAQGWPVARLDFALMAMVALTVVAGLPAVGAVLMVALLVIPAAAARLCARRLGAVVALAMIFGALSGAGGTLVSALVPPPDGTYVRGWPTGPLIVVVAAAIFTVVLAVARVRAMTSARAARLAHTAHRARLVNSGNEADAP